MLNPIRRKPLKGEQDQDEQVGLNISMNYNIFGVNFILINIML